MKRVIRWLVFDSNSSMSHSCVVMPAEQYERWKEGNLYYYKNELWNNFKNLPEEQQPQNGMMYTEDEAINFLKLIGEEYKEENYDYISEFFSDYSFYPYEYWSEDEYCEFDEMDYTTPNGEDFVVICKYGRDG